MVTDERLSSIATALVDVPGVEAVVLGGSRARGTHHATSDVDLGLYYDPTILDLDALTHAASRFDDPGSAGIAGPGHWGPWVDGGGWLTIDGTPVDWILRDVSRVREQCEHAREGRFAFHTQPGHPLGFLDVSYAGEVAICRPLADPSGIVAGLKESVDPYPESLRRAMVDNLWQADFLVAAAGKAVPKGDAAYVLLCCTSALMLCAHAWHASAGSWVVNEKGLLPEVDRLDAPAHGFGGRAAAALVCTNTDEASLTALTRGTETLVHETREALTA